MSKLKLTCLSLNCPERTGGECEALELNKQQIIELNKLVDEFLSRQETLDTEMQKLINDNIFELL